MGNLCWHLLQRAMRYKSNAINESISLQNVDERLVGATPIGRPLNWRNTWVRGACVHVRSIRQCIRS